MMRTNEPQGSKKKISGPKLAIFELVLLIGCLAIIGLLAFAPKASASTPSQTGQLTAGQISRPDEPLALHGDNKKPYVYKTETATIRAGEYCRDLVQQEENGVKYLVTKHSDGTYDFQTRVIEDGDYNDCPVDNHVRLKDGKDVEIVVLEATDGPAYAEGELKILTLEEDDRITELQFKFEPLTVYVYPSDIRETE